MSTIHDSFQKLEFIDATFGEIVVVVIADCIFHSVQTLLETVAEAGHFTKPQKDSVFNPCVEFVDTLGENNFLECLLGIIDFTNNRVFTNNPLQLPFRDSFYSFSMGRYSSFVSHFRSNNSVLLLRIPANHLVIQQAVYWGMSPTIRRHQLMREIQAYLSHSRYLC